MPTYGYQCKECDHTFEVVQKITDDPLKVCEKCKGEIRRLIYPVGISFKGSGFHINDYSSSNGGSTGNVSSGNGNGSKEPASEPEPVKAPSENAASAN